MIQKVFKESFLYTFANHAPLLVNIIILPIITPYLTANDYGIYGLALAYTGIFSSIANLGFIPLFQNSFFKEKEHYKKKWGLYFGILIIWRFIYGLFVMLLLWFVFKDKLELKSLVVLISLLTFSIIFFDLTKIIGLRLCQYSNNHKTVYTLTFITSVVSIISTFIGVYFLRWGYMAWIISSFIAGLIQFIYFSYFLFFKHEIKPSFNFTKVFIKDSLKFSIPLIPHEFSGFLMETSDRLVLDASKVPLHEIGQYNLAYSFSNYFKGFNDSMNMVLSPIYFSLLAKNDLDINQKIKNITLLWFYFILYIGFNISLWLKEVFYFLYQNESLQSGYYLSIFIIMGFTYQPFYVSSVDRAIFFGKSKSILKISFVAGIINIILNSIFIPIYGVMAAVLSTFISYIYMGFSGFFIKEISQYIKETYNIWALCAVIICSAFLAFVLKDVHLMVKLLITIIGGLTLLVLWRYKGRVVYSSIQNLQI